ncbi:hypothetical protein [Rhodococcus sp. ACT016]|uniref:hypothetical protein n=1 Tax=Rhodococcus sp. ACT016 TaxID=3134808 RepID=UPI003D2B7CA0
MADDDDTSAGLTLDAPKRSVRRRASRSAGPASGPIPSKPVDDAGKADSHDVTQTVIATAAPTPTAASTSAKQPSAAVATAEPIAVEPRAADQPPAESDSAAPDSVAPRGRRGLLAVIAAGIVVVALVATGGWLLYEKNAASERDAQRNAFEQTARQTVLNLTTIKPDTAKEDVERILAGASGEFKSEFDGREDPFVSVVKEAGVTTVGKILESGIESENGNTAKVLVAARADVSTPDGTQNGPRDFRMRVTVTDDGGSMSASKVEFVP